jgi:Co/Zn/Cd efflux system component
MRTVLLYALTAALFLVFICTLYFGINAMGRLMKPTVIHHEQEVAHCYTAGKMFFVSIACVPKS